MAERPASEAKPRVEQLMRTLAANTLEVAPEIHLLFVTNIRQGDLADFGPDGLQNAAQYYTRRQADAIVRSFQDLGLTVEAFFDELAFLRSVTQQEDWTDSRQRVVYTTAEGGTGSGRRALIPALCNLLSLPVLNSGAHACSLVRHKFHANAVLQQLGVRVPRTWQFGPGDWAGGREPPGGARVIVKPTYEGMCIGVGDDSVQVVDCNFAAFVRHKSRQFGQPVLVQEFVSGEEVGVPIIRSGSTYALEPMTFRRASGEPFDQRPKTFEDQHLRSDVSYGSFDGPPSQIEALQEAATLAFDGLEMSGVGRIDFRVDADGRAWAFDTNESPPPLPNTSYAFAMEEAGFSLHEMLAVWLGVCLREYGVVLGV